MQFKWKKLLAASITCMVLTGVSATTMAAYSLSEEVKAPTPALLQASQIGVRTYTTTDPALLAQPDKDAILVMSFGTTFPDTRAKTIEATVNEIKAGKIEYRTDKAGNVQAPIGKVSFTDEQLLANYIALADTLVKVKPSGAKGQYMKTITLSTTMGPGVKVDVLKANSDK